MASRGGGAVIPAPGGDDEIESTVLPSPLHPQPLEVSDATSAPPHKQESTAAPVQKDKPKDFVAVHRGVSCCGRACEDRWGIPIIGERYQCVSCDHRDWVHNLCGSCYAAYPYKHPDSPIDRSLCLETEKLVWHLRPAHRHLYETNHATAHVFVAARSSASDFYKTDRLIGVLRPRLIRQCMRPTYPEFMEDANLTLVELVGRTLYLIVQLPWSAIRACASRRSTKQPLPTALPPRSTDKPTNTNVPTPTPTQGALSGPGSVEPLLVIMWGMALLAGLVGPLHTNMIALGGLARGYMVIMNLVFVVLAAPLTYESGNRLHAYLAGEVPASVAVAPASDNEPTTESAPTTPPPPPDTYAVDTDPTNGVSTRFEHPDHWFYDILKDLRRRKVSNEFATEATFLVNVPPDTLAAQHAHVASSSPVGTDPPSSQVRVDGAKVFSIQMTERYHQSIIPAICMALGSAWCLVQMIINEVTMIQPSIFSPILQLPTYDPYDIASETVELCSRLDNDSARLALRVRITPPVSEDQGLPIVTTWFIDGTNLSTNETTALIERETFTRLPIVAEDVRPVTTRASTATSFTVVLTEDDTTGGDFIDAIVNFPGRPCSDLTSAVPVSTHEFVNPLRLVDFVDGNRGIQIGHLITFLAALLPFFGGLAFVRAILITSMFFLYPMWCAFDRLSCSDPSHCVRKTSTHGTKPTPTTGQVVDARPIPGPTPPSTHQHVRTCGVWVHDLAQYVPIDFAIPDNCLAWRQIRRFLVLKTKRDVTLAIGYLHALVFQSVVSLGVLSYYVVIGSAPLKPFIVLLLLSASAIDAILMLVPLAYVHQLQSSHHVMLTKHVLAIRCLPPTDDPVIDTQRQRSVEILESMIAELAIEDDYITLFGVIPSVGLLQTLGAIAVSGISTIISTPMQFHM